MRDAKPKLTAKAICEVFEAVLPEAALLGIIRKAEFEERTRKRDALAFVRAMVIAASTGYGGRQRDVARLYFESGAQHVVRSAFYAWFDAELEIAMNAVARRAIEYAASLPLDLPPLLAEHGRDWHIVDSSTVKLPIDLFVTFPGTGDYAALKVHKRISVGHGTVVDYHISPAREHDALHFKLDESWRGLGLLVDLGYASLKLLRDCKTFDTAFVIRLKDNWKPRIDRIHRGDVATTFFKGTDIDTLIDSDTLILAGRVVDATVTLGPPGHTITCRLVGVPAPDGSYRFYLTSLPRSVGPRSVADIYRVRWEIESDNKIDKSCSHLDEISARTPAAARALVHASITSSMLACLLVHKHRLSERRPRNSGTERKSAPLHPQSLARAMGCTALRIAETLALPRDEAIPQWEKIAAYLCHLGQDPNWRSRPSILDQMRGWRVTPGRPRRLRIAVSTRNRTK